MKATLKSQAKKALEELSEEKLRVVVDFINYLRDKEELEASLEILSNHELMAQIEEAEKSFRKGTLEDFVPWDKVKRNV